MEDKEILRRILQGFKLIPAKFPLTYTTIAGRATPDLAKRVNAWIQTNFPNSLIRVAFDTTHGILKFYRRMQEPISYGVYYSPYDSRSGFYKLRYWIFSRIFS